MAVTVSPQGLASIITKPIHFFAQCFPPRATYTEKDYPDLTGKVSNFNSSYAKCISYVMLKPHFR